MSAPLNEKYYVRNPFYAYAHTMFPVLCFFLILYLARQASNISESLLIFFLAGFIQYRLYFPLHDCSHLSLFQTKQENYFWGYVLGAILFTPFINFREEHLKHHQFYGSPQDPAFYEYGIKTNSNFKLFYFLLQPLWFGTVLKKIRDFYSNPKQNNSKSNVLLSSASIFVLILIQGSFFLITTHSGESIWRYFVFMFMPLATLFLFLHRFRMYLEHAPISSCTKEKVRTIISPFYEKIFLAGLHFNYHEEHHRFPHVSSCHLRHLHEELFSKKDIWNKPVYGYLNVFKQIVFNLNPPK